MANPNGEEGLGRTIVRGAAWGLGFALVSVPIGILLHSWFDPKPSRSTDEDDNDELEEAEED